MTKLLAILALILMTGARARANVVGADTQNFNPTNDGLDFVTVHSSETLTPGVINFGFFINYAVNSLPNYDGKRSLESYLFTICAHKLTDHLRREGRRPAVPLAHGDETSGDWQPVGRARPASSIVRSGERRGLEEKALAEALREQVMRWRERGDWLKLQVIELLVVRGWANKEVAALLSISEQQVANFKFDFLARLRAMIKKQDLNEEIFPELYEDTP